MCVVAGHREDVLPSVHARHPAGRTQMGKWRPGAASADRLLADGGIRSGGRRTFVPSAPPHRGRWGTAADVDRAVAVEWTLPAATGWAGPRGRGPPAVLLPRRRQ